MRCGNAVNPLRQFILFFAHLFVVFVAAISWLGEDLLPLLRSVLVAMGGVDMIEMCNTDVSSQLVAQKHIDSLVLDVERGVRRHGFSNQVDVPI